MYKNNVPNAKHVSIITDDMLNLIKSRVTKYVLDIYDDTYKLCLSPYTTLKKKEGLYLIIIRVLDYNKNILQFSYIYYPYILRDYLLYFLANRRNPLEQ